MNRGTLPSMTRTNEDSAYTETIAEPDDAEGKILNALAGGMPYAFIVATSIEPLRLRVASEHDVDVIRALITQTLNALPDNDETSDEELIAR